MLTALIFAAGSTDHVEDQRWWPSITKSSDATIFIPFPVGSPVATALRVLSDDSGQPIDFDRLISFWVGLRLPTGGAAPPTAIVSSLGFPSVSPAARAALTFGSFPSGLLRNLTKGTTSVLDISFTFLLRISRPWSTYSLCDLSTAFFILLAEVPGTNSATSFRTSFS